MALGMHAMFYSPDAIALREFIRDKLGFSGVDVGDGWLIFDMARADLGVHPSEGASLPPGAAQISFFCDDIHATVADLREKGVEFVHDVEDHGYGWVTHMRAPGDLKIQLYQAKYIK